MTKHRADSIPARVARVLDENGLLDASLLVGLSGGVDSVVLLHAVAGLRRRHRMSLGAIHVHHGLSPHADSWSDACARLCDQLTVPLTVAKVAVQRARGESLEAAARAARYAVFRAQQAEALLLAHHRDDQAETVLLQLLRGAGTLGLAAMPENRVLCAASGLRLVRPLLHSSRAEIEAYAATHSLRWVHDASNRDVALDRNYLRLRLLPELSARFPGCSETLARAADNLADAQQLLEQLAAQDAAQAVAGTRLSLSALRELDPLRQRNLLRWFLQQSGVVPPSRNRLAEVLRQMFQARADAQPRIELDGWTLRRFRGWLALDPARARTPPDMRIAWQGERRLSLPDGTELEFLATQGAGLSREQLLGAEVTVRSRSGGERLRLAQSRPTRSLKNLLQEAGIAAWRRPNLPLLFVGDQLAWVAELGADCRFAARPGEPGVLVEWHARAPQVARG